MIRAFDWRGNSVDAAKLMATYGVVNHPAGPGPAMRLTTVTERFGRALFEVTVPVGYPVRMVIPGEDRNHATDGGRFTQPINTGDHTYYPRRGDHGPFGFAVAGTPSDYVDGIGTAYDQYANPADYPPASQGNNYGHLDLVFAWDNGAGVPVPPTDPQPTPPPVPPGQGITLTVDESIALRAAASTIHTVIQNATNRRQ